MGHGARRGYGQADKPQNDDPTPPKPWENTLDRWCVCTATYAPVSRLGVRTCVFHTIGTRQLAPKIGLGSAMSGSVQFPTWHRTRPLSGPTTWRTRR